MKTMSIAAFALAFASPVAAQTSAALPAHQGHGQHKAQPTAASHTDHAAHASHGQSGGDHSQHPNCCGDADGKAATDCCEGAQASCCAKHAKANRGGATATTN